MNKKPLLLLTGLFLILTPYYSFADDKYHGELCWQVFNQSGDPYWKYKFGIYEKEGGHIALYGSVDYGENGISASHGNAVIVGSNIKLTIVSTDHEEGQEVWSETFAAKLDASTLNGTWNALSLENKDNENIVSGFRDRGTIRLVDCP